MAGEASSLLQLFQAERSRVLRLLDRITGCRAVAEDLSQEAFLRLWHRPASDHHRSYLFRTAQNLAIDHLRAQRVRRDFAEHGDDEEAADEFAPDRSAAARQQFDRLLAGLRELPERAQRAFLLNRVDGLSYAEIARHLGVSVSTVEKDMIRTLDACRRLYRPTE